MPDKDDINGERVIIKVPLNEFTRDLAREAGRAGALEVMSNFLLTRKETCPVAKDISKVRLRLWLLIAFLSGLGILNAWAMLK